MIAYGIPDQSGDSWSWCIIHGASTGKFTTQKHKLQGRRFITILKLTICLFFQEGLKCVPLWIAAWYLAAGIFLSYSLQACPLLLQNCPLSKPYPACAGFGQCVGHSKAGLNGPGLVYIYLSGLPKDKTIDLSWYNYGIKFFKILT